MTDQTIPFWQLEVSTDEDFAAAHEIATFIPEGIRVGQHKCVDHSYGAIAVEQPIFIRSRLRDLAGNYTSWSEPIRVVPGIAPYYWSKYQSLDNTLFSINVMLVWMGLFGAGSTALYSTYTLPRRRRRGSVKARCSPDNGAQGLEAYS